MDRNTYNKLIDDLIKYSESYYKHNISLISDEQFDMMLKQANKALRKEITLLIENLREKLLGLLAKIEVNIDYPEYDDAIEMTNEIILPEVPGFNTMFLPTTAIKARSSS